MKTTAAKTVSETGFATVGYVQRGRQNTKTFYAVAGARVIFVQGQDGTRETAMRVALRADRLVAMWRAAAK